MNWCTDLLAHRRPTNLGRTAKDHPHIKHKTLAMTMIYERIADKTVADEYFAVTAKVEALDTDQPRRLGCDDEGHEIRCVVRVGRVPRAGRRGCWR